MGQCLSSIRREGVKNEQVGVPQFLNSKADRKRSTTSTPKSWNGDLSTTSTRKSMDGRLSTTSTRKSVDGRLSTTSPRKSVDGRLSTTSTRKSVDGRLSTTSTRKSVDRRLPTTSSRKSVDGKLSTSSTRKSLDEKLSTTSSRKSADGKLSTTSSRKSLDGKLSTSSTPKSKSVDEKLSTTSTRRSVDGFKLSTTSTRKSVDGKFSTTSTPKSVDGKPSTTSTRKSVDRRPSTTSTRKSGEGEPPTPSTRKSVEGRPGSTTSTRKSVDGKRSTTVARKSFSNNATKEREAESVRDWFGAGRGAWSTDDSKLFEVLYRHKEDVASTEPREQLGWYLLQEGRRESLDHEKSWSRDTPVTPPSMSSSKRDDHARSSTSCVERRLVKGKSLDWKTVDDHRKLQTREVQRRKPRDRNSIDMKSVQRKSVSDWVESKSIEGESPGRKLERNDVEPSIADVKDMKDRSPLDIRRGFSPADQNSNGFEAIKSRDGYFTRSTSSPARLTYLPESRECSPDDLDFLARRFLIDKQEKISQDSVYGGSVLAGQNDRTESQAPRDSRTAQKRDEIGNSYRKSASKAASLDLDAFKSMAMAMVAT